MPLQGFLFIFTHGYRMERPAGLLITAYVYIVYIIALRFEGYVVAVFGVATPADGFSTAHSQT